MANASGFVVRRVTHRGVHTFFDELEASNDKAHWGRLSDFYKAMWLNHLDWRTPEQIAQQGRDFNARWLPGHYSAAPRYDTLGEAIQDLRDFLWKHRTRNDDEPYEDHDLASLVDGVGLLCLPCGDEWWLP